ncbi:nucleotidyltransferase [Neobacillus drentensis]|uniref:nucleotidyltransferase n=1 Tax=Neobacillus drentensis TaxID=220684 RepID=UPI001F189E81|nr:nucleotidyltransferase [Neobacillus drentensis]ULT58477.1 nucleotidyltransferase [Neobacillus drentensis]
MNAVGLIVEYNPFHNGHAFHLAASKEAAGAEVVIAVMSGNFLQRGEPALVSKWYRTKMALLNGVDIVFELPYMFAVQKAEIFASGAISILDAAGCDSVCFGSESGELSSFTQTIDFMNEQKQQLEENIHRFIATGVSYPKAVSLAYHQLSDYNSYLDLAKPNNILGIEYIKAIRNQQSTLKPLTVPRKNADYHDEHFASETIASATSIRKAIFSKEGDQKSISQYVPAPTNQLLLDYLQKYQAFHQWENYWDYLKFRLLTSSPDELRDIYEVEEGLEHRLLAAALTSGSFHEFMERIKTKRYTWTRLQRTCVHILTNTKKGQMAGPSNQATYLRLLGMTNKGKEYLNKRKKDFSLPLVSKLSSYKEKEILLDLKAARVYSLGIAKHPTKELMNQEFTQQPIWIKKG